MRKKLPTIGLVFMELNLRSATVFLLYFGFVQTLFIEFEPILKLFQLLVIKVEFMELYFLSSGKTGSASFIL